MFPFCFVRYWSDIRGKITACCIFAILSYLILDLNVCVRIPIRRQNIEKVARIRK
ncbi:hypothetical protein LEP1GSC043_4183 [Leptospira weilii str. Ecochallenge]|uniref:Uncharacterized protein n=1 Tax=Leptospira weilii str. Ecochallenge TaxID=1049986 RepID=N1UJE6_9LEPT|nr:hypothetical protein LEP1GSC043_4183 [Leptospira weilii str. Ecochallenge]